MAVDSISRTQNKKEENKLSVKKMYSSPIKNQVKKSLDRNNEIINKLLKSLVKKISLALNHMGFHYSISLVLEANIQPNQCRFSNILINGKKISSYDKSRILEKLNALDICDITQAIKHSIAIKIPIIINNNKMW